MTSTAYGLSDWLTYITRAEVDFLKKLACGLPDNPVVINIGAGCGTSGLAFIESRKDLYLVTIDIQKESHPYGCLAGEEDELNKSGLSFRDRYRQIHGDSKKVPWDDSLVDMVFVDDGHSYEDCTGDILAWLPRLKKGGIIAIDDYNKPLWDKPWVGVTLAVNDILLGKYELIGTVGKVIAFRNA